MDCENIDPVACDGVGEGWRSVSVLENEFLIPIERQITKAQRF